MARGAEGGRTAEDAQARITRRVIGMKGVAGTALGLHDGKPCIMVYLEKDDPGLRSRVPRSEGGYPVIVEVTGAIRGR